MLAFVRERALLKFTVATTVAYALALQIILAGVVATQMAASSLDHGTICYGATPSSADGEAGGGHGGTHAQCAICAYASVSPVLPLAIAISPRVAFADAAIFAEMPAQAGGSRERTPRQSQGPPQRA